MPGAITGQPILCLVTDRRRAYAGPDLQGAIRALTEQARWAADAGIDLIHVRERDLDAAPLADLVRVLIEMVRGSATRLVVNDRLDVAIAAGASGVHLRGDSIPCGRARTLAPPAFLIGRSVHGVEQARTVDGADYLIAGTAYPTPSKAGQDSWLGAEGVGAIAAAVAQPVLAIGGITIDRVAEIARAGAAGIAAIGLFLGDVGPAPLDRVAANVRSRFSAALRPRR